jgi:hypothetical protein
MSKGCNCGAEDWEKDSNGNWVCGSCGTGRL